MNRKRTSPSHPAGQQQSPAESSALPRFKTLYGKPKTLTLGGLWAEFEKCGFVRDYPEELATDAAQLQRRAEVVRRSGGLFQQHTTYWATVFGQLGASSESSSGASPTSLRQPRLATKPGKTNVIPKTHHEHPTQN